MSEDKAFLDTNVLIYLYSVNEDKKRDIARRMIDSYTCITSTQALNEASNVWIKKYGWSIGTIKAHLDNIELVCDDISTVYKNTISKALDLRERYGYSYYDCLMLSSALENKCKVILTEDMSDGQIIDGELKIANPFTNTPS